MYWEKGHSITVDYFQRGRTLCSQFTSVFIWGQKESVSSLITPGKSEFVIRVTFGTGCRITPRVRVGLFLEALLSCSVTSVCLPLSSCHLQVNRGILFLPLSFP